MIFTHVDEFTDLVEANVAINFTSVTPSIEMAESKFLKPLVGSQFYQHIVTESTDLPQSTVLMKALVPVARAAVAYLALYLYTPIADAQLSDAGVRRGHSENSPGAFKYQVEALQKAYLERGFQYLEDLVEMMEENIDDVDLVTWTASEAFRQYRSLFIRTGHEFESLYSSIRYPRRLYTLLRTPMLNVQDLQISAAISDDIYQALLAKTITADPEFTAEEAVLVAYLKRAIAHYTVGRGIASLMATMDENGIHLLSNATDNSSSSSKRMSAPAAIIGSMVEEALNMGEAWLNKAITYLNTTASESIFPTWYASITENPVSTDDPNNNYQGLFSL